MRKILLVEDEHILREAYNFILSTEPYQVFAAADGLQALDFCAQHNFDLILLDLMMPVMDGVEFLERFRLSDHPSTKAMIMSNLSSGDMLSRAMKLGAYRNVVKADLTPKQLLSYVRYEVEAS